VAVEFEARALRARLGLSDPAAPRRGAALTLYTVGPGAGALPRLQARLEALEARAVLVTGLAGGCGPAVAAGDVIVGSAAGPTADGAWLGGDPRLLAQAVRALEGASLPHRVGRLLTVPEVVATPEAKARCWRTHQALAVDMESAVVLAWAARAGLPALAVRAVSDGPTESLPPALARAVGPEGGLRASHVLGWLGQPALLPAAWRLWRRSSAALDHLGRFLAAFTRTPVEP
jgi:nucleoside phosphorylase